VDGDRYKGFLFLPADLAEDVELPLELRKEILFTHAQLATLDHWSILEVPWNAPVERVREAYLAKVKVFHPDRHSGRRLGSYRARMEQVFRRLTEARDLLTDAARREPYVRKTAPADDLVRMRLRELEDEKRVEERRARLARQNPLVARAGRVQDMVARGRQAMEEGRWQQALNDLQMAASLDDRNPDVRKLADEARRKLAAARAAEEYESGVKAELAGQGAAAAALFRRAFDTDPQNGRYAVAAARAALAVGDAATAREMAEKAVRLAAGSAEAHEVLALALHAAGMAREAKTAVEKALEIDPSRERSKALHKKLRWSFLR